MKKAATAAVIVLVIIAAGMPGLFGVLTESRIMGQAESLVDDRGAQVTLTDYRRGWRTSTAKIDVAFTDAYLELLSGIFGEDLLAQADAAAAVRDLSSRTFTLTLDITHGPVLTDRGIGLGLADTVTRLDPWTEGADSVPITLTSPTPVEIRRRFGFASRSDIEVEAPSMTFTGPDFTFGLSGLVSGGYDEAGGRTVVEGRLDRLEMSSEAATFTAQNVTFRSDQRMISTYAATGSAEIVIARTTLAELRGDPGASFQIDNLGFRYQASLNEAGNTLDTDGSYFMDSVSGDELNLTDGRFDFAMRNLDPAVVDAYMDLLLQADADETTPESASSEADAVVYRFLAAAPEVEIGPLSFNRNGDALEARVYWRGDTEMLPPQAAFALTGPVMWPRLFTLEAELDVAGSVAEWLLVQTSKNRTAAAGEEIEGGEGNALAESRARERLARFVDGGMIEETETGYRLRATYENGVIEINGVPLPMAPDIF